jgi:hypothetical protein
VSEAIALIEAAGKRGDVIQKRTLATQDGSQQFIDDSKKLRTERNNLARLAWRLRLNGGTDGRRMLSCSRVIPRHLREERGNNGGSDKPRQYRVT